MSLLSYWLESYTLMCFLCTYICSKLKRLLAFQTYYSARLYTACYHNPKSVNNQLLEEIALNELMALIANMHGN